MERRRDKDLLIQSERTTAEVVVLLGDVTESSKAHLSYWILTLKTRNS